eukprot:322103_1
MATLVLFVNYLLSSHALANNNQPGTYCKSWSAVNISFTSSKLNLPIPLYDAIAASYKNSLHIIGGLTNDSASSNMTYSTGAFTMQQFRTNTTEISFSSDPSTRPDFWHPPEYKSDTKIRGDHMAQYHHFQCPQNLTLNSTISNYRMSASIGDKLYIVQSTETVYGAGIVSVYSCIYLYLIIYDMDDQYYVPSATYHYEKIIQNLYEEDKSGVTRYIFVYVYSRQNEIIAVATKSSSSSSTLMYYIYDIQNDKWSNGDSKRTFAVPGRTGIGCAYYISNDTVYFFGGKLTQQDIELRMGQKCDANPYPSSGSCQYLPEAMAYPRSHFHIKLILNRYFLIYGGTTDNTLHSMEVFDLSTDTFLSDIPYNIDLPIIQKFNSLIFDDYLLIIGGETLNHNGTSQAIKYSATMISEIFSAGTNQKQSTILEECTTTYFGPKLYDYQPEWYGRSRGNSACINVDGYLFYDQNQLIFEVLSGLTDFQIIFSIYGEQYPVVVSFHPVDNNTLQVTDFHLIRSGIRQVNQPTYTEHDRQIDISDAIQSTAINPQKGYFMFWMHWTPVVDMGFGHVFGEHSFGKPIFKSLDGDDIIIPELENIKICGTFQFNTTSCSLDINFPNRFIVNDYLQFNWTLFQATSLNVPVHITSPNIVGINHVINIYDNVENASICVLCDTYQSESCTDCSKGIYIRDVIDYNISENVYSLHLSSALDLLTPGEPMLLKRNVEQIQFLVEMSFHLDGNDTFGLYPNAKIHINPIFANNAPFQPQGVFQIEFDEQLSFQDNKGQIFIDFYEHGCILNYNDKEINCFEPIIVPTNMQYKSIQNNIYNISISSSDTELIGQTTFSIPRLVQVVSLEFSESLHLGQNIKVLPHLTTPAVYQSSSSIVVSNEIYGIHSIINIEYEFDSLNGGNNISFIKTCEIHTPITGSTVRCDKGIALKIPRANVVQKYTYFNLSSTDTYLEESNKKILINHCPVGSGLTGSNFSAWICSQCEVNKVGVFPNSICVSCNGLHGASCLGSSNLIVNHNHWISISLNNERPIICSTCPSGQCCKSSSGCNYITDKSLLCADNRNPFSILCSKCVEGFSELFLSTACGKCEKIYYLWLLFPFSLALFWTYYLLILTATEKKEDEIDDEKRINNNENNKYARCKNGCNECKNCCQILVDVIETKFEANQDLINMIKIIIMLFFFFILIF